MKCIKTVVYWYHLVWHGWRNNQSEGPVDSTRRDRNNSDWQVRILISPASFVSVELTTVKDWQVQQCT